MKIYLAARYGRKADLGELADQLQHLDIECTSRWLYMHERAKSDELPSFEEQRLWAAEDLQDIEAADLVICFTEQKDSKHSRGGRHVEAGFAIASGKPVICVGPAENIFYALPQVQLVENWLEAVKILMERIKHRIFPTFKEVGAARNAKNITQLKYWHVNLPTPKNDDEKFIIKNIELAMFSLLGPEDMVEGAA